MNLEQSIVDLRILDGVQRARSYFLIIEKYKTKIDDLFINLINVLSDVKDLALLGLCLRNGADPNAYIKLKGTVQSEHILSYALGRIKSNIPSELPSGKVYYANFSIMVISMFIYMGTDPNFKRFKTEENTGSAIRKMQKDSIIGPELSRLEKEDYQSLQAWLGPQDLLKNAETGERYILEQVYNLLTNEQLRNLLLYIDKPSGLADYTLEELCIVRGDEIIKTMDINLFRERFGAYTGKYYYSIKSRNINFVKYFLIKGNYPMYTDINLILTEILTEGVTPIEKNILLEILEYCVAFGAQMDGYQWKSMLKIKGIEESQVDQIYKAYTVPYIEKMSLSVEGQIPRRLRRLAFNCNIPYEKNKSEILDELIRIANLDENILIKAFEERFTTRNTVEHNSFLKFMNADMKPLDLISRSQIMGNPVFVNDHQTVTFEAADGLYYFFLSDYFIPLLKSQDALISQKTGQPMDIPLNIRFLLEAKLKFLEALQIEPTDITDVLETYHKLKEPDKISDQETNDRIKIMKIFLSSKLIVVNLEARRDAVDFISQAFSKIGLYMENLKLLDITHFWATFYTELYKMYINPAAKKALNDFISILIQM